jgi:uncharacterized membrane protein YfcA
MKKTEGKAVGLPNYFKKIGIVLIVLVIVVMFILKGIHYNFDATQKENIKIIYMTLINIGLAFIALAKEKIEDEMFVFLKLKSFYGAFFFGIVFTIIYPILDVITNDDIQQIPAQQLVTMMLFSQISTYFLLKRSENK